MEGVAKVPVSAVAKQPGETDAAYYERLREWGMAERERLERLEQAKKNQAGAGRRAGAPTEPERNERGSARPGLSEQVESTVLWLVANVAALPASAMATFGLDDEQVMAAIEADYGELLGDLRMMHNAAKLLSRPIVGRLLVGRLTGLALQAQTGQELAAITRAFRSLPDWAWEEEGEQVQAKGEGGRRGDGEKADGERRKAQVGDPSRVKVPGEEKTQSYSSALPVGEEPRMNRAARRRLEKLTEKTKG